MQQRRTVDAGELMSAARSLQERSAWRAALAGKGHAEERRLRPALAAPAGGYEGSVQGTA